MTEEETRIMQAARVVGFQRCFSTHQQIVGIGPPPPPGRLDPFAGPKQRAEAAAARIFAVVDPDMDKVAEIVGKMKNILASPSLNVVRADPADKRCAFRAGFVVGNRPPIQLCPLFFTSTPEQQIRTLIHECAHLAGIGDAEGELYYLRYNCLNEAPDVEVGRPVDRTRPVQADTWAKYVNCVSGQPADKVDVITPGTPGAVPGVGPRTHVVRPGDYLTKIAKQYYGDPQAWRKIYDANRATIGPNPDKIFPGQQLMIP
jgi:nucleoid-associated protein YgaU